MNSSISYSGRRSTNFRAWAAVFIALLSIAGCSRGKPAAPADRAGGQTFRHADAYPIRVLATVGMVADVVRAVGGPQVKVTQLLGAGVDPHTYKPTRDDTAAVINSNILFYNGLMLEGKMAAVFEEARAKRPAIALAESLPIDQRLGGGEGSAHADPHVWMDVSQWRATATAVADALSQFDPTHAEDYWERAKAWQAELGELHEYCKTSIATIPETARVVVTSHDAFQYFGRAYGVEVQGIQGISTESEAGLQRINELVEMLVTRKVPAVFCESSVSEKSIAAVVEGAAARGHTVQLLGPLFSDAMGIEGTWEGSYCGMLDHNATLITRGLGGTAPEKGWRGKLGGQPAENR